MRVTAKNFDDRARTYLAAKARKESGEEEMKAMKDAFVTFLRKNGALAEHGKKSLVYRSLYEAMASFGQTTTVDAEAVEEFRSAFSSRRRSVTLADIFEARVEYVVMPTALQAIERLPKRLQQLFHRVQKVKAKAPSLSVKKILTLGPLESRKFHSREIANLAELVVRSA